MYQGKTKGPARIIMDSTDFHKMKDGDIIIAPEATPDYLSLLYRASGIIIQEDSITSHANLYSKTLKLPGLMAVNHATAIFFDSEMIEIDDAKRTVRKI